MDVEQVRHTCGHTCWYAREWMGWHSYLRVGPCKVCHDASDPVVSWQDRLRLAELVQLCDRERAGRYWASGPSNK